MTILDFAPTGSGSLVMTRKGVVLVQVNDDLARVTRPDGRVVGYIERFEVKGGTRYRAKRFVVRQRAFAAIGEFWRIDDAVDSLRFG